MYAMYTMRRTQIYLGDDQHGELARRAAAAGVTVSEIIRGAIDDVLEQAEPDEEWRSRWRQAVADTAGIAPYLPEGTAFVDEMRAEERRRRSARSAR